MVVAKDKATKFLDLPLEARITADKRTQRNTRGGAVRGRGGRSIASRGNFRDNKSIKKFPSSRRGTVFKSSHYDKRDGGSRGNRRLVRGGRTESSSGRRGVSHSGRNFNSSRRGRGGSNKVPVGASTIDILQEHAKSLTKRAKDLQRVVDIARTRGQQKVRSSKPSSRVSHNSRSTKKTAPSGAAATRGRRSTQHGTSRR